MCFFLVQSHRGTAYLYKIRIAEYDIIASKASLVCVSLQRKIEIRGVYSNSNRQRRRRIYFCTYFMFLLFVPFFFFCETKYECNQIKCFMCAFYVCK